MIEKRGALTQLKQMSDQFLAHWGGWTSWFVSQPRTDYPYARDLGDGLSASVVMPVIQWLQRAFCEAPLIVQRQAREDWETIPTHPLTQLIARPNAFYGPSPLWMATITDWCWAGESYWRILRDGRGQPGELWWLPPWSIEPKWPADGSVYISHYEYRPEQRLSIRLERDEVVHFRHGLDPRSPRHGLPPLRAVIRDIWTDEEAANWVASLLRNMGVPGLILSPKNDNAFVGPEEMERVKEYVRSRFRGDHRGEPMALGAPLDVHKLAFSPSEFDLSVVRDTAEERVCAAFGIPPAVVGFGTGLETTKVGATMREMVQLAWSGGLIPIKRQMSEELFRTLLPAFEARPEGFRVHWDYREVKALQEDENEKASRIVALLAGGILMRSEGRRAMGLESTPEDEVYVQSSSLTVVDPKDQMPEPEPAPLVALPASTDEAQNGNGNGARNGQPRAVATREAKQGTLEEWLTAYIGRQARRLDRPPASVTRLATRLWTDQGTAAQAFESRLRQVFRRYGSAAATAAREVLRPEKATAENTVRTAIISERLPILQIRAELSAVYRELYQAMMDLLVAALDDAGFATLTAPSLVQSHLQMVAQERVGLLDLTTEARTAILETLEQATAAGLSEDAMISAIQDAVPRGRWLSIETRAQIIARTESRYATSIAASRYAREQGMSMLILDARLGPTDAACEERSGWVVTPAQAEQLAGTEHPGGTFQALPISAALAHVTPET